MKVAQAKRIFWKEYRAQRSIWVGIMLIIIMIQALMLALTPLHQSKPLGSIMAVGTILTSFYALASASVLFAGEREESTDGWLRILPSSPVSLFGGKICWLLASWFAGTVFTGATAHLFGRNLVNTESVKLLELIAGMLRYGGSMVAWGLFFSLVCKRVYSAIACATVAFLMSGAMIQFMAGMMDILTVCALVGSVAVGRHWLTHDRVIALPQFAIWSDKFNLECAMANAIESSPGWKMFRRQLWLEWRNSRWLAAGLFLGLLVTLLLVHYVDSSSALSTHCVLVFAFLPLLIGTCTYRGEQYREAYRFQSHVGASPAAIWSAKHVVWGILLFVITGFFSLPLLGLSSPVRDKTNIVYVHNKLFETLPLPENALPYLLAKLYWESAWNTMALWLGVLALMYSIGHICSLLIKRSVTCLLVAMVASSMLAIHLYATLFLNVPISIALGLPVAAMMLFSVWRTSGWLQEQNNVKDWLRMAGVAALLFLCCGSSWTMWRMFEVVYQPFYAGIMAYLPLAGLFAVSGFGFFLVVLSMLGLLIVKWRRLTASRLFFGWCCLHLFCTFCCMNTYSAQTRGPSSHQIAALTPSSEAVHTGQIYRDLELLVTEDMPFETPENQDHHGFWTSFWIGEQEISEPQSAWLAENEPVLDKLIVNTNRSECAPEKIFEVSDTNSYQWLMASQFDRISSLLRLKALSLEKDGHIVEAWEIHCAFLRFQGHLTQHQSSLIRYYNLQDLRRYMSHDLVRWISHPDQNSGLLSLAAEQFSEITKRFSTLEESFELESILQQWAVRGGHLGHWGSGNDINDWPVYLNQIVHTEWPMERTRSLNMLRQIEEREKQYARYLNAGRLYEVEAEIAADSLQWWDLIRNRTFNFNFLRTRGSDEFWKLAASTPVIQSSQTGSIAGIPSIIQRPSIILFEELEWLRYQRLVFLSFALRMSESEGLGRPQSLKELVELKLTNGNLALILKEGEGLFGEREGYVDHVELEELQRFLFYREPANGSLIEMDLIQFFLNRRHH